MASTAKRSPKKTGAALKNPPVDVPFTPGESTAIASYLAQADRDKASLQRELLKSQHDSMEREAALNLKLLQSERNRGAEGQRGGSVFGMTGHAGSGGVRFNMSGKSSYSGFGRGAPGLGLWGGSGSGYGPGSVRMMDDKGNPTDDFTRSFTDTWRRTETRTRKDGSTYEVDTTPRIRASDYGDINNPRGNGRYAGGPFDPTLGDRLVTQFLGDADPRDSSYGRRLEEARRRANSFVYKAQQGATNYLRGQRILQERQEQEKRIQARRDAWAKMTPDQQAAAKEKSILDAASRSLSTDDTSVQAYRGKDGKIAYVARGRNAIGGHAAGGNEFLGVDKDSIRMENGVMKYTASASGVGTKAAFDAKTGMAVVSESGPSAQAVVDRTTSGQVIGGGKAILFSGDRERVAEAKGAVEAAGNLLKSVAADAQRNVASQPTAANDKAAVAAIASSLGAEGRAQLALEDAERRNKDAVRRAESALM